MELSAAIIIWGIIIYFASLALSLLIQYFVMKNAIKNGIIDAELFIRNHLR